MSDYSRSFVRFRVPLGFLFAAWYLIVARPSSLLEFAICAVLIAVGCVIRSWAAGYLFKGKRVAVGGPYAMVRNPLYVGSFIIGVGCCAALWTYPPPVSAIVLWSAFFLSYVIVYPAKTRAEEKELSSHLGAAYDTYAGQVPRFWPTRGHVSGLGVQHFSGELYRRNREYQCVLGSLAVLAVLYLKYLYGN